MLLLKILILKQHFVSYKHTYNTKNINLRPHIEREHNLTSTLKQLVFFIFSLKNLIICIFVGSRSPCSLTFIPITRPRAKVAPFTWHLTKRNQILFILFRKPILTKSRNVTDSNIKGVLATDPLMGCSQWALCAPALSGREEVNPPTLFETWPFLYYFFPEIFFGKMSALNPVIKSGFFVSWVLKLKQCPRLVNAKTFRNSWTSGGSIFAINENREVWQHSWYCLWLRLYLSAWWTGDSGSVDFIYWDVRVKCLKMCAS